MTRSDLKNVSLAVIVILVGVALRSIDALTGTHVWRWSLGDLVAWASFTVAAATAAFLAGDIATRRAHPVMGSPALSRFAGVVGFGIALWLLHIAVKPVLVSAWTGPVRTVFAVGLVGLAGSAVWIVHRGFDEIAAAVRPRPAQAAAPTAGPPTPTAPLPMVTGSAFCGQCGATIPAGNRFCGACGAPRR